MTFFQAILMGILQGFTEFLPVSSSGHLAILKHLLGVQTDTGILFDILLHVGTLISIFVAFRKEVIKLIVEGFGLLLDFFYNIPIFFRNLFNKNDREQYYQVIDSPARKMVMLIIISTIPTAILGLVAKEVVEYAQRKLIIPGICLIITAVLLFLADRFGDGKKKVKQITYLDGFSVGMMQGVATLPGISRSGSTIAVCMFLGFDRKFAVKYSFLMAIPAILGAAVLELKDITLSGVDAKQWLIYIVGMIFAAVIGYIAIKTVMVITRSRKYIIFSIYCLVVGLLAIVGNFVAK